MSASESKSTREHLRFWRTDELVRDTNTLLLKSLADGVSLLKDLNEFSATLPLRSDIERLLQTHAEIARHMELVQVEIERKENLVQKLRNDKHNLNAKVRLCQDDYEDARAKLTEATERAARLQDIIFALHQADLARVRVESSQTDDDLVSSTGDHHNS